MEVKLWLELAASVSKDPKRQDLNEDAFAEGDNSFALADGASESYDSKSWARLLTEGYALDQNVDIPWVTERVRTYANASNFESLSWSGQAAYERGSFATLLGLKSGANASEVDVLAIGDSLAVHVRDGFILASYPFQQASQFDTRPQLLSTLATANDFVWESGFFYTNSITWSVKTGDQILLVTDAVGHWLLSHSQALTELNSISDENEFERLVVEHRLDKTMHLDDSTFLRIVIADSLPQSVP